MKKAIDLIIAFAFSSVIALLFALILYTYVEGQISFIQKLSDGNFRLLVSGILYCILYPSLASIAGGLCGLALKGVGNWFQSQMIVFVTCLIIFVCAGLYIIGNLWYQAVPVIWSNITWANFFLYTGSAVTCLGDLTFSIIFALGISCYLQFEKTIL